MRVDLGDQLPVLGRQPLAQRLRALPQRAQVVGDAGGAPAVSPSARPARARRPARLRAAAPRRRRHLSPVTRHARRGDQQHCRAPARSPGRLSSARRARRTVLGALGVAAEPEQVLGGAAGDGAVPAADRRPSAAGQQRGGSTSPSVMHPGVGAGAAALHRQPGVALAAGLPGRGRPRASAPPGSTRQPPCAVAQREHPQHRRRAARAGPSTQHRHLVTGARGASSV